MWKQINSGKKSASWIMEHDKKYLLNLKEDDDPLIHFYDFLKPSFTYGVFVKPEQFMHQNIYIKDFDFSKRPTGGGVLFHLWDFAFSIFIPKNHEGYKDDVMDSYKYINQKIATSLKEFLGNKECDFSLLPEEISPLDDTCKNFCFSKPTKYDIMLGGKKLAGAAQRRKSGGYLHQGSISLFAPDFSKLKPLFPQTSNVLHAMQMHTHSLFDHNPSEQEKELLKNKIRENIFSLLNESIKG